MRCFAFYIVVFILTLSTSSVQASHEKTNSTNVLVLASYHQGDEWTDAVITSIQGSLSTIDNISLSVEYLDARRHPGEENASVIKDYLSAKYKENIQDLIIVSDNAALNLFLTIRPTIFHETAVVFCGINNFSPELIQGQTKITGVGEHLSVVATIETVLRLFPKTKSVYGLADNSSQVGQANLKLYRGAQKHFKGKLSFEELLNLTTQEASHRLSQLPGDAIILYLSGLPKPDGGYLSRQDTMNIITESTSVPVFTLWATAIGEGAIGGIVVDGKSQGRLAAKLAQKILDGKDPDGIPVVTDSPNVAMFDHKMLQRLGVSQTALPPESVVINKPDNFYKKYQTLFFVAVIVVIVLGVLIALLARMVSRQKVITRRLKESQHCHQALFDINTDGIVVIDPDSQKILEFNDRACTQIGYTRDEFARLKISDIDANESEEDVNAHVQQILEHGFDDFETKHRCKNGLLRDVRVIAKYSKIEGHPLYHCNWRDITLAKKQEKVLTSRLELMKYSLSHTLDELLIATLDKLEELTDSEIGFYHLVNESDRTLSLHAWSTQTTRDFCSIEGHTRHYEIEKAGVWADCIRERKPIIHNDYFAIPHRKGIPDNHAQVHRELVVPVIRENQIVAALGVGNKRSDYTEEDVALVSLFADLSWDIAENKLIQQTLAKSEERFQKMFRDHDAVMLLIHPESGQIIDANDAAISFYGYSLDQFKNMGIQQINTLPADEIKRVKSKVLNREQKSFEFLHKLASGETRNVEVHVSNIELNNEAVLFSIVQDITQRKRLMEEQSRSAQLAALGTVAAGVAHEVNNPIQGIMNYASLIDRRPDNFERNQVMAQKIFDLSKKIAKITQDLLFYSKNSRVEKKYVDIKELVENALGLTSNKIKNNDISLEIHVQNDLPRLFLQPQSIQQVLLNLVDNAYDALRYRTDNTTVKTIAVAAFLVDTEDPCVCLEVSDNGTGMTEAVIEKSTTAFFTTKPPAEGTGLGLSIVHDIVKKHNGHIEIDSVEGEYTKIRILIPAVEVKVY